VEQRQALEDLQEIDLQVLAQELLEAQAARILQNGIEVENALPARAKLLGERFLLRQALANLLDNALDFTPAGGLIRFSAQREGEGWLVKVFNRGDAIPDFALPRLTERFYSLPRPGLGRKSTGLGLNFVQEVATLHAGRFSIGNLQDGVEAQLWLPLSPPVATPGQTTLTEK
jgi:two-component system sensor histidine kinase CreC